MVEWRLNISLTVRKGVLGLDPDAMTWFELDGESVQIAINQSEKMLKSWKT